MPRRDCPECEGTGWKPVDVDGIRRVARCSCDETERVELLLKRANIPRRYEHCTLENFDIRKDKESGQPNQFLVKAKIDAQRFIEEYPLDYGLLFVGPTGAGKTHLAVAVLRELITQKSIDCLFGGFRDLLKEIQDSYNPVSQTSELRVLQPALDVEVLLLDELAASNPTDWVKETLWYIVNSRYNQKKTTLITTTIQGDKKPRGAEVKTPSGDDIPNFEKSLGDLGVTMRSRLYEMCKVVEMHSDDYRKDIKQAGFRVHSE